MIIQKIRNVKTPSRGTASSAGLDFYVPTDRESFTLGPGESINIPSGIKMVIPSGYAGIFFNKSGVGVKGVFVGACVIDSDYRGEVHLNVHNVSTQEITYLPGQKITQMLILPISLETMTVVTEEAFSKYSNTERGENGFGSTGE